MKDIIANKKISIKADEMKYLYAPQYETITIAKIFQEINKTWPEVLKYMPDFRDQGKLPKQYVINACFTIVGAPFQIWVNEKIKERNEKVETKNDLIISMDPQIAQAFNNSTMISTSHGCGSQMLSLGSKRRRTRIEMEEAKEEDQNREDALKRKNDRIAHLED